MLNISLKEALKQKLQERGKMSRENLRKYGVLLKTIKAPYGYDVASVDRRLRELSQAGEIIPTDRMGIVVTDSTYITHYIKC